MRFATVVKLGAAARLVNSAKYFCAEENGQDLIEYSLLLAFVCLVGAAAFIGMGGSINTIWTITNSRLANP